MVMQTNKYKNILIKVFISARTDGGGGGGLFDEKNQRRH